MANAMKKKTNTSSLEYEAFIKTDEFKELLRSKKRFMTPYIVLFLTAYILMPILTGYTDVLEVKVFGWITGTWIYAFGMFVMVWALSMIYVKKSAEFDAAAEEIINKNILQ